MNLFIKNELTDPIINQKVQKLFIFGLKKINFFSETGKFKTLKPDSDYVQVHFKNFILILFLKQYKIPKFIASHDQEAHQYYFKVLKHISVTSWQDFIFEYLVQQFQFEIDLKLNNSKQVKRRIELATIQRKEKQKIKYQNKVTQKNQQNNREREDQNQTDQESDDYDNKQNTSSKIQQKFKEMQNQKNSEIQKIRKSFDKKKNQSRDIMEIEKNSQNQEQIDISEQSYQEDDYAQNDKQSDDDEQQIKYNAEQKNNNINQIETMHDFFNAHKDSFYFVSMKDSRKQFEKSILTNKYFSHCFYFKNNLIYTYHGPLKKIGNYADQYDINQVERVEQCKKKKANFLKCFLKDQYSENGEQTYVMMSHQFINTYQQRKILRIQKVSFERIMLESRLMEFDILYFIRRRWQTGYTQMWYQNNCPECIMTMDSLHNTNLNQQVIMNDAVNQQIIDSEMKETITKLRKKVYGKNNTDGLYTDQSVFEKEFAQKIKKIMEINQHCQCYAKESRFPQTSYRNDSLHYNLQTFFAQDQQLGAKLYSEGMQPRCEDNEFQIASFPRTISINGNFDNFEAEYICQSFRTKQYKPDQEFQIQQFGRYYSVDEQKNNQQLLGFLNRSGSSGYNKQIQSGYQQFYVDVIFLLNNQSLGITLQKNQCQKWELEKIYRRIFEINYTPQEQYDDEQDDIIMRDEDSQQQSGEIAKNQDAVGWRYKVQTLFGAIVASLMNERDYKAIQDCLSFISQNLNSNFYLSLQDIGHYRKSSFGANYSIIFFMDSYIQRHFGFFQQDENNYYEKLEIQLTQHYYYYGEYVASILIKMLWFQFNNKPKDEDQAYLWILFCCTQQAAYVNMIDRELIQPIKYYYYQANKIYFEKLNKKYAKNFLCEKCRKNPVQHFNKIDQVLDLISQKIEQKQAKLDLLANIKKYAMSMKKYAQSKNSQRQKEYEEQINKNNNQSNNQNQNKQQQQEEEDCCYNLQKIGFEQIQNGIFVDWAFAYCMNMIDWVNEKKKKVIEYLKLDDSVGRILSKSQKLK